MRTLNGSNIVHVKSHNRQAILLQLLRQPLSRVELAQKLELSGTTVTNLVNELLAEGWIVTDQDKNGTFHKSGRGRPRTLVRLDPQASFVIGVHIGIGVYRIAQVDLLGTLTNSIEKNFDPSEDAVHIIGAIAASIKTLISTAHLKPDQILGIGFGASGLVDSEQGINVYAPSLGWQEVPVAEFLGAQTGLPVVVENNARAMALAEMYFGQGHDIDSLAFIFGRVGVGAGLVMQGRIVRGIRAGAGEIGHTIILPNQGIQCSCGQYGCLETLVTQPILIKNLKHLSSVAHILQDEKLKNSTAQLEHIFHLARGGEAEVLAEIERVAYYLGIALSNLINTINPERIIVGGMYAQGADLFLPLLRQQIGQSTFGRLGKHVQVEATSFGLDAGVIGAASVALVKFFYETDGNLRKTSSVQA